MPRIQTVRSYNGKTSTFSLCCITFFGNFVHCWDKHKIIAMETYTLAKPKSDLCGTITLSPSKNISNRDITINALKNSKFDIESISEKDAIRVFDEKIKKGKIALDTGRPAKAIRLIRAFLTYFKGDWIVTGSAEMHKRPVGDVIDLLQSQGINIKYIIREEFPPLKIIGKGIKGPITRVDAVICNQFISTALLISPTLTSDDAVALKNQIIRSPYINQTLKLLRYLGVNTNWNKDEMLIEHHLNDGSAMTVEADWLSASYWYQMVAIADKAELTINGIEPDSVQSDAIVKELFEPLGVKTTPTDSGVKLTKIKRKIKEFVYDFSNNPHLIPTMVTTCVALNLPFRFSGIEVMNSLEPERAMALQSQLKKVGATLTIEKRGDYKTMVFDGDASIPKDKVIDFKPLNDHRVIMALSALTVNGCKISIENPRAVSRSYPNFWNDLKQVEIQVEKPNPL